MQGSDSTTLEDWTSLFLESVQKSRNVVSEWVPVDTNVVIAGCTGLEESLASRSTRLGLGAKPQRNNEHSRKQFDSKIKSVDKLSRHLLKAKRQQKNEQEIHQSADEISHLKDQRSHGVRSQNEDDGRITTLCNNGARPASQKRSTDVLSFYLDKRKKKRK